MERFHKVYNRKSLFVEPFYFGTFAHDCNCDPCGTPKLQLGFSSTTEAIQTSSNWKQYWPLRPLIREDLFGSLLQECRGPISPLCPFGICCPEASLATGAYWEAIFVAQLILFQILQTASLLNLLICWCWVRKGFSLQPHNGKQGTIPIFEECLLIKFF